MYFVHFLQFQKYFICYILDRFKGLTAELFKVIVAFAEYKAAINKVSV